MQVKKNHMYKMLEELLDKEHTAILEGAFEDIGKIANHKERLLDRRKLDPPDPKISPDPKILNRLRQKSQRNHHLLAAVIRGVKSVTSRLENLHGGPDGLNTYDKTGQRTTLKGSNHRTLQHRA